ncbi:MAG: formaldehyde-activating enzyme [Acidimicrobiales bacterium]
MSPASQFGEAFVGHGAEAAHVNTVLGARGGPVETAWVTALATPRAGHAAFVVALQPGLAVTPPTLFVNKAATEPGTEHARLTWGAAQAGVAVGVAESVADGTVARGDVGLLLLVAAVWVDPAAADEAAVFANNRDATHQALRNGAAGRPAVDEVLDARHAPSNPFLGNL